MDRLPITKETRNIIIAVIVGIMVVVLAILMSISFEFNLVQNLVMSWVLTTGFALFVLFLVEPIVKLNPIRTIEKPVLQEVIKVVEKPVEVIKEIQIPIENKTIEVVEKPVIKEVFIEVPVEKRITRYIERKHRKLNIPKFKFIGSTKSRSYHKRTCRFSKMIKKKYKAHSNSKAFFKKKHYHACEACIKRK